MSRSEEGRAREGRQWRVYCDRCVYWEHLRGVDDLAYGTCRRRAPRKPDGWSETTAEDWCGEGKTLEQQRWEDSPKLIFPEMKTMDV